MTDSDRTTAQRLVPAGLAAMAAVVALILILVGAGVLFAAGSELGLLLLAGLVAAILGCAVWSIRTRGRS